MRTTPGRAQLRSVTDHEKDVIAEDAQKQVEHSAPALLLRPLPLWHALALGLLGVAAVVMLAFWLLPAMRSAPLSVPILPGTINVSGRLEPLASVTVGSGTSGVISDVLCEENMRVKKGQTCARIDPRPFQAQVDQDRASLATANAQLEKDQAAYAYALELAARYRALFERSAASQDQVDNVAASAAQDKAQVDFDRASVAQHAATLEVAKIALEYTNIVSPIDGIVVSRNAMVGETIVAQFQSPTLFVIASDLSRMQLDTRIGEKYVDLLRVGDKVTYSVDALPNRSFEGTIRQIRLAPEQQSNDVSYMVSIGVDNKQGLLRPGMLALTTIHVGARGALASAPK